MGSVLNIDLNSNNKVNRMRSILYQISIIFFEVWKTMANFLAVLVHIKQFIYYGLSKLKHVHLTVIGIGRLEKEIQGRC